MYKFIRLAFVLGVITIIILLAKSIFNDLKMDPIYSKEKINLTGYLIKNNLVELGDGKIHELNYKYTIYNEIHYHHFQSNLDISKLKPGDSIILEVSIWEPKESQVIGYYETKNNKTYKSFF